MEETKIQINESEIGEIQINEKAARILKCVSKNIMNSVYRALPHELISCPNLQRNANDIFNPEQLNYDISFPRPLTFNEKVFEKCMLKKDFIMNLVEQKEIWKKKMINLKISHSKCKSKKLYKRDFEMKKEKKMNITLPKYLVDFVREQKKDPDQYFDGVYNWYYTNGCLNIFDYNNEKFIIRTSDQFNLEVGMLQENGSVYTKLNNTNFKNPILSIDSCNICNKTLITSRQKNIIQFHQLNENLDYNLIYIKSIISDEPYISTTLNKYETGIFCTSDMARVIKVWDIEYNNPITKGIRRKHFGRKTNNWNNIKYIDKDNILFLDRNTYSLIDLRIDIENQNNVYDFNNVTTHCDELSVACCSSLSENLIYVGSNHSFFLTDIRNKKAIYRWTHQMYSVPFVGATLRTSQTEELLCFTSQLSNEKRVMSNNLFMDKDIDSTSLFIPTFDDYLMKTKLNGYYLNPFSQLEERLRYSLTGLDMTRFNDKNIIVYFQNSIGDLFSQNLTFKDEIYNSFEEMEKSMLKSLKKQNEHRKLVVTDVATFNNFFVNKPKKKRPEKMVSIKKPWKRSVDELSEYVDLLAPKMLQAWGYGISLNNKIDTNKPSTGTLDTDDKVSAWLYSTTVHEEVLNKDNQLKTVNQKTHVSGF